mmetsp:Transcript_22164/g.45260  ORF Transcript_22164/g.45260 Transcript_22164/m.45260 type:complete len:202 (+) Transcript_22164:90-695(+)|eukprot:CAMPEP_0119082508 /NCGR_PEP_ID=MMETSP1178-20130426/121529_1 /TAXON_ID=33656 /ORGANISM="unid sp, Strain CCMP2000" /LENGTH=201 /DNA_ID=CAMNT_0007065283 /DNA_START=90 /DNA_END=695 /DNA_ORIENTATION=-
MEITDEQMRQQLQQQQRIIDALLQTRKMLIQQQIEASAGLAQQMASLSFDAEQHDAGRKKRRDCTPNDDMHKHIPTAYDSWGSLSTDVPNTTRYSSCSDALDEGLDDDEIVYRSCSGGDIDDCSAAESAQRRSCLEQMEILSQITAELQADVWSDASAASAALARLLELSARLSAAREAYEAAESEAGLEHQMGTQQLEPV